MYTTVLYNYVEMYRVLYSANIYSRFQTISKFAKTYLEFLNKYYKVYFCGTCFFFGTPRRSRRPL